jgi:hypothetical protein
MDIEEFKAQALDLGTLRPNRFKVRLFPPLSLSLPSIGDDLEFWGEASEIPLIQLGTHQMQRHGYGSVQKRPNMVTYQDWQVIFRLDQAGLIYTFFNTWMNSIVNHDISTAGSNGNSALYEVAYRDTYLADLQLQIFDTQDNTAIGLTLIEAYPLAVSPSRLDWADNNSYLRSSVIFAFTDFIQTE